MSVLLLLFCCPQSAALSRPCFRLQITICINLSLFVFLSESGSFRFGCSSRLFSTIPADFRLEKPFDSQATKVYINITDQNIANSYQHFQQVFQQPAKLENTKKMSKTGGNYRTRKTHQVTKQILKKVNITDAGHFQRLRMQSRPVSAMEM